MTITSGERIELVVGDRGDRAEVRVLVVDDHPVFVAGLRSVLTTVPGVEVVGDSLPGLAAVESARRLRPQVVIMPMDVPRRVPAPRPSPVAGPVTSSVTSSVTGPLTGSVTGSVNRSPTDSNRTGDNHAGHTDPNHTDANHADAECLRAARQIRAVCPEIAIIVLTGSTGTESLQAAVRAGVRGYLARDADRDDIARSVHAVSRGQIVFGAHVVPDVVGLLSGDCSPPYPFPELTARERAVLELVADGISTQAIARELELSLKTVRNYLSRIFLKIDVRSRSEAAVVARRAGLGH